MTSTTPNTKQELREKIRAIMRDWEGLFPFPDPDDASTEAKIAFGTADKVEQLLSDTVNKVLNELKEQFPQLELESRYDYDYKLADSTIKQHNKIIAARNEELAGFISAIDEVRKEWL